MRNYLTNLFVAVLLVMPAIAQKTNTEMPVTSVFSASTNYQNKLHFYGRTDSLQSGGFFPMLSYEHKSGLYARTTAIFIHNAALPLDYAASIVEAGYQFPKTDFFSGNIFYSRFLYKEDVSLVQAALTAQTGINTEFKTPIVNINIGGDLKFSKQTDYGATAGIDHLFIIKGKNKSAIAINPTATLNAGTRNFLVASNKPTGLLGLPNQQQNMPQQKTSFTILSYDVSLPVVFVKGKFNCYVSPALTLPQHVQASEMAQNIFYVTTGLGIRL